MVRELSALLAPGRIPATMRPFRLRTRLLVPFLPFMPAILAVIPVIR